MADNDTRNTTDSSDVQGTSNQGSQEDYNKLVQRQTTGTTTGESMSTGSGGDLGTVGGGTIPGGGGIGSGNAPGGMNTSNSTVGGGGTVGGTNSGGQASVDRGSETSMAADQNSAQAAAEELRTADRDPIKPVERPFSGIADPMTARDPQHINEQSYKENNP